MCIYIRVIWKYEKKTKTNKQRKTKQQQKTKTNIISEFVFNSVYMFFAAHELSPVFLPFYVAFCRLLFTFGRCIVYILRFMASGHLLVIVNFVFPI